MKKYYFYHTKPLLLWFERNFPVNKDSILDFNKNLAISNLSFMSANAIDDTLHFLPTKTMFGIPSKSTGKTYSDLMDQRAADIVSSARKQDQTITVFWSGGIDSTAILVSFLKQGVSDMLVIACSAHSIYENRNLFDRCIDSKVKIQYVQDVNYGPDARTHFVRTGGAASFMGGDTNALFLYSFREQVQGPPSVELFSKMINFFISLMPDHQIDLLYQQIISSADQLGITFSSMWDLVSFYDMVYKINDYYWCQDFPYLFQLDHKKNVIKDLDSWSTRFYLTPDFYGWGLYDATIEDRIGSNLFQFKKVMKDYIYDFNDDLNYYENKLKISSYGKNLLPSKYSHYLTIDENLDYSHPNNDNILLERLHAANQRMI